MFAKAINTLKRLYQAESCALKTDHGKFIEKLETQIGMLTDIKQTYDARITELKEIGNGGSNEEA